ncbi:hypothetical protein PENTCL1PPCAC_19963, partial [Pristionchus entomophagus]
LSPIQSAMVVRLWFLVLSLCPYLALALITCRQCKTTFGIEMCNKDCEGDLCYSTDTFPSFATALVTRSSGCVLGLPPAELGCRYNQDGQKLCLCNTNICNTAPESLPNFATPIRLRARACDCMSVHPNKPNTTFLRPCAASFCTYQRTQITAAVNLTSLSYSSGCSMSMDYDMFNSNSTDLQIGPMVVPPPDAPTTCYTGSALPFGLADPFTSGNCTGQFCVISVGLDQSVYRGCLTILNVGRPDEALLTNGYYKDVDGREQWICSGKDYCNMDLKTLIAAWPEELTPYANLSLASPSYDMLPSLRQQPPPINPCTTGYITDAFTRFMLSLSGLFTTNIG